MSKPRIVFVTYYRLVPTGQIGIFKRCMRLISGLQDDFEIHLVNFGPLPHTDPLFAAVSQRIEIHPTPDENLGDALEELFRRLEPQAVVIGESPIRGSLRMAHRVANALGIWQIAIDNYYGPVFPAALVREFPRIDRWIILGLTPDGAPGFRDGTVEVIPPLIRFPEGFGNLERDRIAVIGYDKQTLLTGSRLLDLLPADQKADFFIAPQWEEYLRSQCRHLDRPGVRVLSLPPDMELYGSLARSRVILGKAGFQQVVEGLLLGAPIVCQACGGGLEDVILAEYLKPYIRFVPSETALGTVMPDIVSWLDGPPVTRWSQMSAEIHDPIAYGAGRLAALVAEAS